MTKKRETRYDKLLACARFAEAAFDVDTDDQTRPVAKEVSNFRRVLEDVAPNIPKSAIAKASVTSFFELISGQEVVFPACRENAIWHASRKSVAFFFERFPDFLEQRERTLANVIRRKRVINEYEFHLIQDAIYKLEAMDGDQKLLKLLYRLSDNAEF
ncbi:MAG: hypothetical protein AAFS02_14195 [Pseudomonadota bacterium]